MAGWVLRRQDADAHEIGYVLLGPDAHSTVGLMAASLDLPRLAIGGFWFDRIQAAIIRARLACDISRRGLPAGDGPGWVPPTIRRLSTACEFLSPIPANRGGPNAVVQQGAMARTTACSSWEAVITAAVVLTGFTKPAGAGQASAPQLAVGIQDEANVPARILTVAQAEVARVFRRAGVETIWVATTTADLVIVIRSGRVAERTSLTPDTTGQATVNSATGRGRLAYVFYNHIEERRLTTLNPSEFLGHIISHEIGHLLGIPHATTGIMRAMWDRADLVLASEGLLLFRPDQAALLRHRLAREL